MRYNGFLRTKQLVQSHIVFLTFFIVNIQAAYKIQFLFGLYCDHELYHTIGKNSRMIAFLFIRMYNYAYCLH